MGRNFNDGPNEYGLRRQGLGLRVPMVGGTETWRPSLRCLRLWRTATGRDTRTGPRRGFYRLENLRHAATVHALCNRAEGSHDKAAVNGRRTSVRSKMKSSLCLMNGHYSGLRENSRSRRKTEPIRSN